MINKDSANSGTTNFLKETANKFSGLIQKRPYLDGQFLNNGDIELLEKYNVALGNLTDAEIEAGKWWEVLNQELVLASPAARNAAVSNQGLAVSLNGVTFASKLTTLGIKLLKTALFSIGVGVIMAVLQKLIEWLMKLFKSASETAAAVKELTDEFSKQKKEIQENVEELDKLLSKYEKLSKGVNEFGQNVSLSAEDLKTYHEVANQIAELFPTLVKGWDDEGNAILKNHGNIEKIKSDALKEANDKKYEENQKIIDGKKDLFKDYRNKKSAPYSKNKALISEDYETLKELFYSSDIDEAIAEKDLYNFMGIVEELLRRGFEAKPNEKYSDIIKRACRENPKIVEAIISDFEREAETRVASVKPFTEAYFENKISDKKPNLSESSLNFARQVIENLDSDFYDEYDTPEKVEAYIGNLIKELEGLSDADQKLLEGINNPKLSPRQRQNLFNTIQDVFGKDSPISIYLKPEIEKNEESIGKIDAAITKASKLKNGGIPESEDEKITEWGLEDYRVDITNGRIRTKFGNIDMNNRPVIKYDPHYLKENEEALRSWTLPSGSKYTEIVEALKNGEEIVDSVYGMWGTFETSIRGRKKEWDVAFSPILSDGTFLDQSTVNQYLSSILSKAVDKKTGLVNEEKVRELDAQGKQIGDIYVKGIFAGVEDSANRHNGKIDDISKLMHFSGDFGAINLSKRLDWESYFEAHGINTEEALIQWEDVTKGAKTAKEAMNFWEAFEAVKKNAEEAADGITSLSSALSSLQTAYELFNEVQKDFNSSGKISSENIQKILAKFPELEDELYEYIMGVRTGVSVMDLLKSKSDSMASMTSESFRKMYMSSNMVSAKTKAVFANAFKRIGLEWSNTQSVMANVNSQIVDANGKVCTNFSDRWDAACKAAGASVSTFAAGMASLLSGGTDNISKINGNLYYTDRATGERVNLVDVQAVEIAQDLNENKEKSQHWAHYGKYVTNGVANKSLIYSEINKYSHGLYNEGVANKAEREKEQKRFEETLKKLGTSSDPSKSDSSSSDSPSYESPVDAIINRIKRTANLAQKDIEDIDKQLELIDVEDDPEKYKQLVEQKLQNQQKLDRLYLDAQDKLHNEAEYVRNNSGYNMESWFDEFGNATETYYNVLNSAATKTAQDKIKSLFDEVKKYKDAWKEFGEARHTANKDILDSEEKITECLEKQRELTETIAKSHNDSYKNERTELEREISDLEHRKSITNSSSEKTKIDSQSISSYLRGINIAQKNMGNVYSDAEYWREHLNNLLSSNGLEFNVSKWFSETGDVLEQFNADLNTINNDNLKALIQSDVNLISEKKSSYMEFYEWQQDLEEKLYEARQSYLDDLKSAVDELFELRISKTDSERNLLSSHYDLINAIEEEQHNLNKELDEANIAGAKMNEIERETLFTKKEHAQLSSKLNTLLSEAQDIQANYTRDLANATKDTIEEITNNYERQYELKLKEYEVVKAELSLTKAEQKLKNVENEKSVRTWNGSQWIYEAVLQDVIDAQNEVADAKYALQQTKNEQAQTEMLNSLSATSDNLKTQQNQFATSLEQLSGNVTDAGAKVSEALNNIATVDLPMFGEIMSELGTTLKDMLGIKVSASDRRKSSGGSNTFVLNTKTGTWTDNSTGKTKTASTTSTKVVGWQALKKSKGYKTGSKNTKEGWAYFDEDGDGSEVIMTKYGKLRRFAAGETVFSKEMTDKLYDMVNGSYANTSAFSAFRSPTPAQYVKNNNTTSQDNRSYSINGVNIEDSKGKEIIHGLADYLWRES